MRWFSLAPMGVIPLLRSREKRVRPLVECCGKYQNVGYICYYFYHICFFGKIARILVTYNEVFYTDSI